MKAEVRCGQGPSLEAPRHTTPMPILGIDEEATPSCSIWGDEVEIKAEGPKVGRGVGLSRSRASRCAPSRILAQHPRT